MSHDIFDLIIVISLTCFMVGGFIRGLIGEIAGLCAAILGFWGAAAWNTQLAARLDFISNPDWRLICASVIIFFGIMVLVGVAARLLEKIASFSFMGWLNRLGGALFGLFKGVIIWVFLLLLLQTLFHNAEFMRDSRAMPYFRSLTPYIQQMLPPELARHVQFEQ